MEVFSFYNVIVNKANITKLITFCYSSALVVITMIVFSFLLGPISSIQYYVFLHGFYPSDYLKYGTIFYLAPRIIVECIKTPLESLIVTTLVICLNPTFNMMLLKIHNT